jgi:D-sedoheptulose 7-phosphate isomerase
MHKIINKKELIIKYIDRLKNLLSKLDVDVIEMIIDTIENTSSKGKIYIIGNGGSAVTGTHMVNDLSIGLKLRDIKNLNIECLSDNSAVCTAIANDIGYENIFYAQLKDKITQNDMLIAISCSGNSKNIIKAVDYVKEQKAVIIGMTGFSGGQLKKLCDISYHIDSEKGEYGVVEDLHMILDHIIYTYYISLKPENKTSYTMVR